jgi:hypothetical protein
MVQPVPHLREASLAPTLDLDREPEVDVARRLAPANAPVLPRDLVQNDRDVIGRNTERREVADNPRVERAPGIQRAANERVDGDVCEQLWLLFVGRTRKAMRFVHHEPHSAIVRWNPERFAQRTMNAIDEARLLLLRVSATYFDQDARH